MSHRTRSKWSPADTDPGDTGIRGAGAGTDLPRRGSVAVAPLNPLGGVDREERELAVERGRAIADCSPSRCLQAKLSSTLARVEFRARVLMPASRRHRGL